MILLVIVGVAGCSTAERRMAGWGMASAGGVVATITLATAAYDGSQGKLPDPYTARMGIQLGLAGAVLIAGAFLVAINQPGDSTENNAGDEIEVKTRKRRGSKRLSPKEWLRQQLQKQKPPASQPAK